MTEFTTEVEGAAQLQASLALVANRLDEMPAAGIRAGQAVKHRAASAAPKATGALSRSIRATVTGIEVTVGTSVRYAAFQEFGTINVTASPYLRPALEASATEIVDAYADEIQRMLETVEGA